jgi:hypothetical protein
VLFFASRNTGLARTGKGVVRMRLVGKIFVGFILLGILGTIFDGKPSLTNNLAEAILSGDATAEQWEKYNKILNEEAELCVIISAKDRATAGAWNPDGISVDYTSAYATGDYLTENNRDPNPLYSGSVAISGTNAFGAIVKSRIDGFGTMQLEKDGSNYKIRCR